MIEPISPDDVADKKLEILPTEVIECFNEMIGITYCGGSSEFQLRDVANKISLKMNITIDEVYDKHYLDVEEIYRKAGWKVKFVKPDYTESFNSYFTFSK